MSELVVVQEDSQAGQGPNRPQIRLIRHRIPFHARLRLIGPGKAGES